MPLGDLFRQAREMLNAVEVGELYGLRPDRHGFCTCIFHAGDDTPSLKLYDGYGDERSGYYCFACGARGDVTSLAQQACGLATPLDALKQLNHDFNLGMSFGPPTPAQREQMRRQMMQRERADQLNAEYRRFRNQASNLLCLICRRAFLLPDGPKTKRDVEALKWSAWAEYTDDLLWFGSPEVQIDFYLHKTEVFNRCVAILTAPSTPIAQT